MSEFKWRHSEGEIVLWAVRWYCRYGISYRDLEQMMGERRVGVDHSTIYRWVQRYAPEIEKRLRWQWRRPQSTSWLTATPMQVHPVEVWDLLNLLGLPAAWTDAAFLSFHDRLSKHMPSHEEMEEMASLFREMEQTFGETPREEIAKRLEVSGLRAKRLLRILRDEATADRQALTSADRPYVSKLLRDASPMGRLISRNTRALLRHYFRTADREVQNVFLEMSRDERAAYEQVERYIRDTYNQASLDQRSAVGFVMTIYRKRLASSSHALTETLKKRREKLLRVGTSKTLFTEEDLPDDDLADDSGEGDEISQMERAALLLDDRSSVEDLLRMVEGLPEDTKSRALRTELAKLRDAVYRQTMIFTQFTDTLDFVREELVRSTDLKVCVFSGGKVRFRSVMVVDQNYQGRCETPLLTRRSGRSVVHGRSG